MKPPLQSTMDSKPSLLLDCFPEMTLISVGAVYTNFCTETNWWTGCYYKEQICKMFEISIIATGRKMAVNQMSRQHHVEPALSLKTYMWFFVTESRFIISKLKCITFYSSKWGFNKMAKQCYLSTIPIGIFCWG